MSIKFRVAALALLCASTAFAQQTATIVTNYSTPVTITTSSGCNITNVTTASFDGASTLTTNGTVGSGCGSSGGGGGTTNDIVSLSISPSSYTLGSGAAAPVINVVNNTPSVPVTCSLVPPTGSGFSVTSAGTITATGSFTLSVPTTAGTFSFTPTCSTTASGYTVTVSPVSVLLTVNNPSSTLPGTCSASQTATVGSSTLQRQCTGNVSVLPSGRSYSGALTDLGTVLNGSFPSFGVSGSSPTFTIQSGYYISLALTPAVTGGVSLTANPSYGDGGIISLSTQPGALVSGSLGYICGMAYGPLNALGISTTSGVQCQVQVGTTYYLNLVDTNVQGTALCFGGAANSCASSKVSYGFVTQ